MIRTQMYLEEQIYKDLIALARQEKKSMADVTRNILKDGIKKKKSTDRSGSKVLLAIANIGLRGGDDLSLSENVDHYLYGAPKKHE